MDGENNMVIVIDQRMMEEIKGTYQEREAADIIDRCIDSGCKVKRLERRWKEILRYYKKYPLMLFDIDTIGKVYEDPKGSYKLRLVDERETRMLSTRLNGIEDDDIFWLYKELREERKIGDNQVNFIELLESITVLSYITEVAHKEESCLMFISMKGE